MIPKAPVRRTEPFARFLDRDRPVIIDGGLATALEARGHHLGARLWSAELLAVAPEAIAAVHGAYLAAGADCISTAGYQASFAGFRACGYSDAEAEALLELSVELAVEARDRFLTDAACVDERVRPLVAASIGPYGAYLADGSEYDGRYGVGRRALFAFHERRFRLLADSAADLLLCETLPSILEVEVLLGLLAETPGACVWMSFCCRDGARLADGTPVERVGRLCDRAEGVVAVGVNCVAPTHVSELVTRLCAVTRLPVVVYPNSGETYDPVVKRWRWSSRSAAGRVGYTRLARDWTARGAAGVGGCCRVGPDEIRTLRRRMADVRLSALRAGAGAP